MKKTFREWLRRLESTSTVVSSDHNEEANANLQTLSLSEATDGSLTPEDIVEVVSQAIDLKRRELSALKCIKEFMFYTWFDELAGQLRMSVVSTADLSQLPFGGALNTECGLYPIADHFVYSAYRAGLPLDEMIEATHVSAEDGENSIDARLDVHCEIL